MPAEQQSQWAAGIFPERFADAVLVIELGLVAIVNLPRAQDIVRLPWIGRFVYSPEAQEKPVAAVQQVVDVELNPIALDRQRIGAVMLAGWTSEVPQRR